MAKKPTIRQILKDKGYRIRFNGFKVIFKKFHRLTKLNSFIKKYDLVEATAYKFTNSNLVSNYIVFRDVRKKDLNRLKDLLKKDKNKWGVTEIVHLYKVTNERYKRISPIASFNAGNNENNRHWDYGSFPD